jgi:hypothetical protein
MTGCFNCLLYQRFLFRKVRLLLKDVFVAASIGIRLASLFAFASELLLPQAMFNEDCLDAFQCVRVIWVIAGINHRLKNPDAIANVPPIMYAGLLTPGVNSIYCSITVNHRLTGPGKMVKLCLLFVGKFQIQKFD